jgi:GNAT superfamily N-acetyltransferase
VPGAGCELTHFRKRAGCLSTPDSGVSSTPSTNELVILGAPVALRDGSRVRVRQGHRSDKQLLRRGFERLGPESRYKRFLAPVPQLSEAMVGYLTEVDHHDHEAIIALEEETGEGIGVVRYFRSSERRDAAEFAVTVIDDWQRRGVGTLLLEVTSARAREEGITTFTALMLASNQEMMDVLKSLGPVRIVDRDLGTVEIEMPIPAVGLSPALSKLLRIAARNDVAVALAGRHDRLGARRRALGGADPLDAAAASQQQSGRMGRGILSMALTETQQLRMLERLRSAGEQPVTLDQLRAGGIDFPAVVIGELELNGYVIERVYEHSRQIGVRLLESDAPDPPASRRRQRWRRVSR